MVYRDGKGSARVLRGGPKTPNSSSFYDFVDGVVNLWDLKIDTNIDIAKSKDAYKNGETPKNRHAIRLPINDEDLDKMWNKAINAVKKINPNVNYDLEIADGIVKTINSDSGTLQLGDKAQVCHSLNDIILKVAMKTAFMRDLNTLKTQAI